MAKTQDQPKRSWLVVEFEAPEVHEDMAGWLMMQLGANGCEVEAAGENVTIKATFERDRLSEKDMDKLIGALEEYGLSASARTLRLKNQDEEDWLVEWKKGFHPFPIGKRLLICPPWEYDTLTPEQTEGRVVVLIEPGMAFGTGFHATTQFCLTQVEKLATASAGIAGNTPPAEASGDLPGPSQLSVLDVGTGSGILAIAYAMLDPHAEIYAIELDPVACEVARENFEINGVSHRISLMEGEADLLKSEIDRFHVILSNMTMEDNAALAPDYRRLLRPNGCAVLAGILKEKLPRLLPVLKAEQLEVRQEESGEMWTGLVVSKAPTG